VIAGKNAADATPISAFAAATRRSAAATSGRRSNSRDGTPAGMDGGSPSCGVGASARLAGGSPTLARNVVAWLGGFEQIGRGNGVLLVF
jgi:hypothetical protein